MTEIRFWLYKRVSSLAKVVVLWGLVSLSTAAETGVSVSAIPHFTVAAPSQPLFSDQSTFDAVLTAPINQAYSQNPNDLTVYLDGQFTYKLNEQDISRVTVKIKPRGNYRRANCTMPPLRLNFKKNEVKGTLLDGQDKLKLVGPCKPGGVYKDFVGLEHLAYQVFAVVSDYALATRIMNLSYVDVDKKLKPRTTTAFVIEDIEDLAKRANLKHVEPDQTKRTEMDLGKTALLEVFALLIGNNDFSTLTGMPGEKCCHNVKLLVDKNAAEPKYIPVPYDFDMSGLVNAPYAAPPGTLPIRSVRQRYFNGWCKSDEHFAAAVQTFKSARPAIMQLVDNSEHISSSFKRKTKEYFTEFYELVDDPDRYAKEVLGRCRGDAVN